VIAADLTRGIERARAAAPCGPRGPAVASARRWAELRHVADLRALAGRPEVRVVHDPVSDAGFVVAASRCGGLAVVALRDGDGVRSRSVLLPPGAAPSAEVLDGLRWGRYTALVAP
jgi:hypothetical protein